MTVSTVGLAPAIRKLADERLGVTLALSLHAPDDELRDTLVPVNNRWKVGEALDAAHYYAEQTGRRVSVEYALIRDVNDQPWRADLLGKRLHQSARPVGAREPDSVEPDSGQRMGCQPEGRGARVRSTGPGGRRCLHGARHPGSGDCCRVRPVGRRRWVAGAHAMSRACGQSAAEGG